MTCVVNLHTDADSIIKVMGATINKSPCVQIGNKLSIFNCHHGNDLLYWTAEAAFLL